MHFTIKNSSFKKRILIHQSITEICILDSEIHNFKKNIPDPPIRNRIRLLNSTIQKSIIYSKKMLPEHPLSRKKNDLVPD